MGLQADSEAVNPEMIVLAREARGLSQAELAHRLGISQGQLSKVESGLVSATAQLLPKLARELSFPPKFFVQRHAVVGPSTSEFYHRKRASMPVRLLEQIHALVNIRKFHLERLLRF